MHATRSLASLIALTLPVAGTLGHAQSVPAPGSDVSYVCTGNTILDVTYRSASVAQLYFGGVSYTLTRRSSGAAPRGGVIRYADPVTSWNLGPRGAFLNQNGRTVLSGCVPTDGGSGGSSTVIPVPAGGGSSTIIPVPTPPVPPRVNTVTYTCDGGQPLTVAYLGTNAAQVFWQGITDTFYQTASGSGVQYTNGLYTWVTKGNQGFLSQAGLTQESIIVANNCVERP